MKGLFTRNLAEAYRAANTTPAPDKLQAFLAHQPRPLPCIPTPGVDAGALKFALYFLGAVVLGLVGWAFHH